jgi:DNA polymerase/3'-5' exonuclease PolX
MEKIAASTSKSSAQSTNKKEMILRELERLKITYLEDSSKKWQLRALNKALSSIKDYKKEINDGAQLKEEVSGIGDKIAQRIDEILETGTLKELENHGSKEKAYQELMSIIGVGQSRAKDWIQNYGILTIEQLKEQIQSEKIKVTNQISLGLKYYEDMKHRIPRDEIDYIQEILSNVIPKVNNKLLFQICGSYRRNHATSGDIDVLITHPNYDEEDAEKKKHNYLTKIIKELKTQGLIIDDLTKNGNKKFLGFCKTSKYNLARRIDLLFVEHKSYYSSILYFTGSKHFNVYLRQKLLQQAMSLNEHCLKDLEKNKMIYLKSEEEIFEIANIPYYTPEQRNAENYE